MDLTGRYHEHGQPHGEHGGARARALLGGFPGSAGGEDRRPALRPARPQRVRQGQGRHDDLLAHARPRHLRQRHLGHGAGGMRTPCSGVQAQSPKLLCFLAFPSVLGPQVHDYAFLASSCPSHTFRAFPGQLLSVAHLSCFPWEAPVPRTPFVLSRAAPVLASLSASCSRVAAGGMHTLCSHSRSG